MAGVLLYMNKNTRVALWFQVTELYFTCEYQTNMKISSLKINYMLLCLNSHNFQVFLSVSQNTFSQWLIPVEHVDRKVKYAEGKHYQKFDCKRARLLAYNYEKCFIKKTSC